LARDGRRSSRFRGELLDALSIIEGGHVPVQRMSGSWAGGMGRV
jgi:membrane-bound lytic murein transglycosylase B